jgi:hypothetical protein
VRITGRSVEEWRKSPPEGAALRFARPLPCRELPAFATLEQEQEQEQAQPQPQQVQEAVPEQPQQSHAAVVAPAPLVRHRFVGRLRARMAVRSEAVRRLAHAMHAGIRMRAAWAVPAPAASRLAANIPTDAREMRRVIIQPQLMNKVAVAVHGRRGETRYHQQRVSHASPRIAVRLARHGS